MDDKVRPIDAGELIGYLHEKTFVDGDDRSMVYKAIEEQPTVEVEPMKHGHWIVSDTQRHIEVTYECSECQHEVVGEYEKTPFCGECGARMDSDRE